MKKFSFILLMAALALPMMAQRFATKADAVAAMDRNKVVKTTPVNTDWTNHNTLNRAQWYEWTFESDADLEGWLSYDLDGDGNGWGVTEGYGMNGSTCLSSASYSGGVLYPDNWLISPDVNLDGNLTFWAGQYSSYYPDVFAVYVHVGPMGDYFDESEWIRIGGDYAPTEWTEYVFDMTEYAGAVGCFAIRHYNCSDQWRLLIDDVTLGTPLPPMAMPENLTAEPTMTTAAVAWDDAENANWNLRYRPYVEPTGMLWEFEEDTQGNTNIDLPAGWTTIDADGDGLAWYHLTGENFVNHSGVGHVTSASYQSDVLYPDNWLVSPKTALIDQLSFWAAGQDPSYAAEVFAVYVTTGDPEDIDGYVRISDDITATGEMTEYVFDLAEFEGQEGYVAIRHYNIYDMFRLNVDDVLIGTPTEEAEWIYVNALDATNYTIEGLDPETTYEVQVQAYDENQATAWTESTIFTTLGNEPTEQCHAPNCGYEITGFETATVTITNNEPGATVYYDVYFNGELVPELCGSFEGDEFSFNVTGDGRYDIVAIAKMEGYKDSTEGGVWFFIQENETPVGISELVNGKQIAGVRYFNALGQEVQSANGVTIVVTTYTDGTTSTAKVVK